MEFLEPLIVSVLAESFLYSLIEYPILCVGVVEGKKYIVCCISK